MGRARLHERTDCDLGPATGRHFFRCRCLVDWRAIAVSSKTNSRHETVSNGGVIKVDVAPAA